MIVLVVLFGFVILSCQWWIFEKMEAILEEHEVICNCIGDLLEKLSEIEDKKEEKS